MNDDLLKYGFEDPLLDLYKINRRSVNMATLRESASEYEAKTTKNISDLDKVNVNLDLEEREYTDKDGKIFKVQVIVIDGIDYRVPQSVLKNLQTLIEDDPSITEIKVRKKGSGMNTSYTVIPLK